MNKVAGVLIVGVAMLLSQGCATTKLCRNYGGVNPYGGKKAVQVHQQNIDLTLLFNKPLVGDARLETTLQQAGETAKANGAKELRTYQTSSTTYWFIFPPISFIIHPVVSSVDADAIIE